MFGNNRFRKPEINYRQEEKKILDSVLGPEVYDKRIRPSGLNSTGKPMHCIYATEVQNLKKVQLHYPQMLKSIFGFYF